MTPVEGQRCRNTRKRDGKLALKISLSLSTATSTHGFMDLVPSLNRLNALLSLLQPLDRHRAASAIESAIERPYVALSRPFTHSGRSSQLPFSKPLRGLK